MDALYEIVDMNYHLRGEAVLATEMLQIPLHRGNIRRLVYFLRHPDSRVRRASFESLTTIQPDPLGHAPEIWEDWLNRLESSLGVAPPELVYDGWKPLEFILFDLLQTRNRYGVRPRQTFIDDRSRLEAIKRVVAYVRHHDRRVRVAAVSTFTALHPWHSGSPDAPEISEAWLREVEARTKSEVYLTPPVAPLSWDQVHHGGARLRATNSLIQSTKCAADILLDLLSMPAKADLNGPLPGNDELLRRDLARKLVGYLRHHDPGIRYAAFDQLTGLERLPAGGPNDSEVWENWLMKWEKSLAVREPHWITNGWLPPEDLLADIVHVRSHVKPGEKATLFRQPTAYQSVTRLVAYLRHPERRIRRAAYKTLLALQYEHPGGSDSPSAWEEWLKRSKSVDPPERRPGC